MLGGGLCAGRALLGPLGESTGDAAAAGPQHSAARHAPRCTKRGDAASSAQFPASSPPFRRLLHRHIRAKPAWRALSSLSPHSITMMTRRAALLACALLLLAAAPCARAALLTPCDDGMGGADGGGDLQKTTPTSANARWLLPLVDKVARDQGTLDLLFKPRKGCKLTGFTFDNKLCVPKVRPLVCLRAAAAPVRSPPAARPPTAAPLDSCPHS